ncbi:hypothetical protein N7452_010657 [Penicillium brevicompactum]|uniref:BTB domain-containing protein n=1 Tax=Penicillium brevicompactum TaxID=5074 RepID=A0A9W9U781_PENBR|nr:hypothetical protein N7452_010657 [Penicillium brevicompactum]
MITMEIGAKAYTILESHIEKYPLLGHGCVTSQVRLPEVAEDIGHTLVHFLYTGTYETINSPLDATVSLVEREYERSVMVYHANFHIRHPAFDKKIFSKLPEDEVWLPDYLKGVLQQSFASNNSRFDFDHMPGVFDDHDSFNSALMRSVIKILASHVENLEKRPLLNSIGEPASTECLMVDNQSIVPTECPALEEEAIPLPKEPVLEEPAVEEPAVEEPVLEEPNPLSDEPAPEESVVKTLHGAETVATQVNPENSLVKTLFPSKNVYRNWAKLTPTEEARRVKTLKGRSLPIPDEEGVISIPVKTLLSPDFAISIKRLF